ncbi:RHS repeat domain-containing protein, partial [Candidatus Sumerlaeota bacterium]
NFTYTEYAYDKGGCLTRQEVRHPGYGQLCAFDYYYDDAGNRTKVVLDDDANDWLQYDYDDLYRLTREQRSGTANDYTNTYTYDAVGNRVASNRTTDGYAYLEYFYNDINQLTMYNDPDEAEYPDQVRMAYDANGNMTKRQCYAYTSGYSADDDNYTKYEWDSRNLMTKTTTRVGGGAPTDYTFAYDALGRRESMTADGTTTDYFYEGLGVLVEKTGAVTKSYLNSGAPVGGIISVDDGDDVTYYHYDAIGNVVETTDDIGAPVATYVQDAFGNVISGTASGYHLTTKEYFDDFGLYYFNMRWYDPFTGRFISKGPMPPYEEHPYAYCENDPVNSIDPSGYGWGRTILDSWWWSGFIIVGATCKLPCDWMHKPEFSPGLAPLPSPGNTDFSDGLVTPGGYLKIPNGCELIIECNAAGKVTGLPTCCTNLIDLFAPPRYYPPTAPPPGFPAVPAPCPTCRR